MVTLADAIIEYLMRGNNLLHASYHPHHPDLKGYMNLLMNDIRKARKYIISETTRLAMDSGAGSLYLKPLLRLVPLAKPKYDNLWVEVEHDEPQKPGQRMRTGYLCVKHQNYYAVTVFNDTPKDGIDSVDYFTTTFRISFGDKLPIARPTDDGFYTPHHPNFTPDDVKELYSYALPVPVYYMMDPILLKNPNPMSRLYQSIMEATRDEQDYNIPHISNILNLFSLINNVPLRYTEVEPAPSFRLKGKAQKIPRLRGIQEVSLSLEKGWTVKRYLQNAFREHNSNTGITQGEHPVREHVRVYYRGTDKEYTVNIPTHRKGTGPLKTERRFIVTE